MRHVLAAAALVLAACGMISGADDLKVGDSTGADGGGSSSGSSASSSGGSSTSSAGGSTTSSTGGSTTSSTGGSTTSSSSGDSGTDAACTPTAYGPRFAQQVSGSGWINTLNAKTLDGNPAHSGGSTAALVLSKFGFTIPSTAAVVGIKVDIARSAEGPVSDNVVALSVGGTNRATTGAWPVDATVMTFPVATYGSPDDTWGKTWTPSAVNSDLNFGVGLSVQGAGDAHVDAISITVYTCP